MSEWEKKVRLWEHRAERVGPCLRLRIRAALYDLDQRIADAEAAGGDPRAHAEVDRGLARLEALMTGLEEGEGDVLSEDRRPFRAARRRAAQRRGGAGGG